VLKHWSNTPNACVAAGLWHGLTLFWRVCVLRKGPWPWPWLWWVVGQAALSWHWRWPTGSNRREQQLLLLLLLLVKPLVLQQGRMSSSECMCGAYVASLCVSLLRQTRLHADSRSRWHVQGSYSAAGAAA
jgi:hypothetical protein